MPLTLSSTSVSDINTLSQFLAHPQLLDLSSHKPVDSIVICVSAVFRAAEVLFHILEEHPDLTKTLVLCGGIGHSTPLIYEAVARHKRFHPLAKAVQGLSEARVLEKILTQFFDVCAITSRGCRILVEDQSTNSSANAIESRKILDADGMMNPKTLILVQDSTMQIRTAASFEKAYSDLENPPEIISCPIVIPKMQMTATGLSYDIPGVEDTELWEQTRFFGLIMGEIPRLRLYGPQGKQSITHVDVPATVEDAWMRLQDVLEARR
jgi:hypothetical protein